MLSGSPRLTHSNITPRSAWVQTHGIFSYPMTLHVENGRNCVIHESGLLNQEAREGNGAQSSAWCPKSFPPGLHGPCFQLAFLPAGSSSRLPLLAPPLRLLDSSLSSRCVHSEGLHLTPHLQHLGLFPQCSQSLRFLWGRASHCCDVGHGDLVCTHRQWVPALPVVSATSLGNLSGSRNNDFKVKQDMS